MKDLIRQIESNGYTILKGVIPPNVVARTLELSKEWNERARPTLSERIPFLNRNQPMVYNLQSKDMFFLDLLFGLDDLHAVLKHFLNDQWFKAAPPEDPNYILRSYLARSSNSKLPMHIDSFVPYGGRHVFIMQASMILEDQNTSNGCTMVVPGSHLCEEFATQESFDEAIPVESKAGDVVLWDSRLWHGTLENTTGGSRWAVIATFCRWWVKQAFDIPANLPQELYDHLSNWQRAVLGYCSIPYDDETHGIDMKRSYDLLPTVASDCRS